MLYAFLVKGKKMSLKNANEHEKQHMERVKELGCLICHRPAQAHHLLDTGRRISHYHTIPLCFDHHQNQSPLPYGEAVHKGTKLFEQKYGTQWEMLYRVWAMLDFKPEEHGL